jgi:cell division protein FtsB
VNNIAEENYNNYEEKERSKLSLLFKLIIFIAIVLYLRSILFGEYSISVLLNAKSKKEKLEKEYNALQNQNQKLQKKHFEMIQLTPQEDAF